MGAVDVVVIASDTPQEILGKEMRESSRLTVDGVPASLDFLQEYLLAGRNAKIAGAKLRERGPLFVSLNGVYLCQFLEGKGFTTALVPLFTPDKEMLLAALREKPLAVVISTTFFPSARQTDAIAAFVREHAPEVKIVAGGIHVWKSYRYRALLESGEITEDIRDAVSRDSYLLDLNRPSAVDILVVSDRGETTLSRLLECMRSGEEYTGLDNIAYYDQGQWRINPVVPEPRTEVKVDWRRLKGKPPRAFYPVQAGEGCRFRCKFCDFCRLRPLRSREVQSIVKEIRTIPVVDGFRRAYFTDDNLLASRKRAREFCEALVEADLSLRWKGFMRIGSIDQGIAGLMAASGCIEAGFGMESGDPEMLSRMGKRVTPEEILSGIRILDEHGINTQSYFIVGFPGETARSIRNTVNLLNSYPASGPVIHRYLLYLFAVVPLSAAATPEFRSKYKLRGYLTDWRHSTMRSDEARRHMLEMPDALRPEIGPAYHLEQLELPGLSPEEFKEACVLRNKIHKARKGLLPGESEDVLWRDLAATLLGAASCVPSGGRAT